MRPRKLMALALVLVMLALMTGCATGGSSGSRGSLSKASAESAGKEDSKGRTRSDNDTQGRSRTKTDHQGQTYQEDYYEEEDSGGGFLIGLLVSLFSGDKEEEEYEEYDPYDYKTFTDSDNTPEEYEPWTNADEFGLPPEDEGSQVEGEPEQGGGLDMRRSNLNFWFSPSTLNGDAIQGFTTYTLMFSAYTGRQYRAHAGLYYGRGKKGSQPNIQEGIRWISEAGIDLGTRGYFTSDRSQLGFYMILGLRTGAVSWSYANAIEVSNEDDTIETISNDSLWLFVPYVGLGSSLLQTQKVHLGLNFTVGGRIYTDRTFEDFENDLLKDGLEYKLNFEASFFF